MTAEEDNGPTTFLETSAQAYRIFGTPDERDFHQRLCARRRLISSTFVLGEFKRTFILDAVRLHGLLQLYETKAELLKKGLSKVFGEGPLKRMLLLLGDLEEDNTAGMSDPLTSLEMRIDFLLEWRFHRGLGKELLNTTGCVRAEAEPQRDGDVYHLPDVGCTKRDEPKCTIRSFWERHAAQLARVQRELNMGEDAKGRKETAIVKSASAKVLADAPPYGLTCRDLADLIVALECPEEAVLQSKDRHFIAICDLLNKHLDLLPDSLPKSADSPPLPSVR